MIWIRLGLQKQREYVGEVGSSRLLVDGAFVEAGTLAAFAVNSEDVDDGKGGVEDLWGRLDQTVASPVPSSPIQEQTVHINTCNQVPSICASSLDSSNQSINIV